MFIHSLTKSMIYILYLLYVIFITYNCMHIGYIMKWRWINITEDESPENSVNPVLTGVLQATRNKPVGYTELMKTNF